MATERYEYDPSTGQTFLVSGNARQEYTGDTALLTNGAMRMRGYQAYSPATGRIVTNFSDTVTITRYTNTQGLVSVDVSHGVQPSTLNSAEGRMSLYSVTGQVSVLAEGQAEKTITVDASSVTGIGQRVISYRDAGGALRFESVYQGDEQEQLIRQLFGESTYWATADEVTQRAILGYLRSNYGYGLSSIEGVEGIRDFLQTVDVEGSGEATTLGKVIGGSLAFTKVLRVNAAGVIGSLSG